MKLRYDERPRPEAAPSRMITVPINDLVPATIPIMAELEARLGEVLRSCAYLEGKYVKQFESSFSAHVGCQYGVALGNGTDALEIALRAGGVESGDEVITVSNAGGYATTACMAIGAVPFYCDIERDSLLIDHKSLSQCITRKTRAVVVTHLYGRVVDVDRIRSVVGNDVLVVEDCAQAHGARWKGRMVGGLGDIAAFSFYPTKNLGACGDAGMVVTNRQELAIRARSLKQYGWKHRYYIETPGGRNSRMDELQAAVLCAKLPYLEAWNQERRAIARRYLAVLRDTRIHAYFSSNEGDVNHLFVVQHAERARVQAMMQQYGVSTAIHYPLLDCEQPGLAKSAVRSASLKASSEAREAIFTAPCFPGMSEPQIVQVCRALAEASAL